MRAFAIALTLIATPAFAQTQAPVPHYGIQVVKTYPHDSKAFTEGLYFDKGSLFESTGMEGRSFIRQVNLDTGKVIKQVSINSKLFGEGIAPWNGKIVSLTWRTGQGFVWNGKTLSQTGKFSYTGEGWGLTQNGKSLVMSDGTPVIKFLDPVTFKVQKTISVSFQGQPIDQINELEWVKGELFANVWRTRKFVRINPNTGAITGVVDLDSLPETKDASLGDDGVANGIAYDAVHDRLFVTGKMWPHLYEIKLVP